MSEELAQRSCVPCRGGIPPLRGEALLELSAQLPEWEVVDEHHLQRELSFSNFREALAFVNRVGEIAEAEDHHPDIWFTWGKARIQIFTHKIDGLTESDFVLAAKISRATS
ncbi:MAG: 4a-hydroxytetrahydrobiopterin dehydratase [Myxococcales bacterium]|nr:4a-hydroxytetrahydrobiopterin dehydratase [Myxococcales bacterium]